MLRLHLRGMSFSFFFQQNDVDVGGMESMVQSRKKKQIHIYAHLYIWIQQKQSNSVAYFEYNKF